MTINSGNIFSALSLSRYMISSLPENTPQLRNPLDATALLVHVCMLSAGFRLIGLGEDHRIDANSEPDDIKPLPQEWNATSSSDYAFRYAHSQSALQYLVKVSRLGSKAVINGIGLGDDKVHSFDFLTRDFLSESSFPLTLAKKEENNKQIGALQDCFISTGRITDLGSSFKTQIIQKLAPSLQKEGYEDSQTTSSSQLQQPDPGEEPHQRSELRDPLRDDRLPLFAPSRPSNDPLAGVPRRPFPTGDFPPPGFEDEYEINRPPGRGGFGGERRPLNIGERDLYPPGLGPHDPFRGGGFGPTGGGGGMHPTFDDPLFGGDGGSTGVYDPRFPPGARYDPIGPSDTNFPNFRAGNRPRFPGPGSGPGGPRNPYGGFGGNDFI